MTTVQPTFVPTALRIARGGFTLLELLLVLAIIAMMGAIAAPRITDMFERQKLRGAANDLRLVWDEARITAMRTGQTQVFNCVPETGSYTVKPLLLQSDATDVGQGATVMLSGGVTGETTSNGLLTAADLTLADSKSLAESITFVSCLVVGNMRAIATAQESQTTGTGEVNTQNIGQAVIFYPDGSASTAEVRIQNERGDVRAVQVRGLTGVSRVVEISNVPSGTNEKAGK